MEQPHPSVKTINALKARQNLGQLLEEVFYQDAQFGLDHGVGHSLLLLYDAKVPRGQKNKEFNDLGHDPSNTSISLFYIMTKYFIFITI